MGNLDRAFQRVGIILIETVGHEGRHMPYYDTVF